MYKVTVDDGGQNRTSATGEHGFGNAGFQEIFGLTADTNNSQRRVRVQG